MRELFDEMAGASPLDPQEAVRQAARTPRRKRFYKEAGVAEAEGGFAITLDGKPIRTPSGRQVVIPSRALADAVAAEWAAQGETINPMTMPLTRIANSVVEGVVDRVDLVSDDLAKYLQSDLLFYRAGHPEGLVAREAAHWDPVLFWAAETLGAHFILSEGVMHVTQPDEARPGRPRRAAGGCLVGRSAPRGHDPDRLGAAGAGARPWGARCRPGLGGRLCGRGLERREMGRGRGGGRPPRRPPEGFRGRGDGFGGGEASAAKGP